ncbi:DUF354 domain-containing protein [Candidatus Bathyarchaeota archaeon]|nr:DUF354 domain-containing protein [Candidatus Bathyarchaeota archaeon]
MARVWIDILTPKQVMFFGELSRRLEAKGHDVLRTTRRYREVNQLLGLKEVEALVVGKHGGPTLEGKLEASSRRVLKLGKLIAKYSPTVAISFSSPEAARVAFGLGIPHFCISDSPHAEAVMRLSIPVSRYLFTPKIIPLKAWYRFGATPDMILQYNALDPVVWIRALQPDARVLDQLKLTKDKPIIVFRIEETFAAYLLRRVSDQGSVITPIIQTLLGKVGNTMQIVVIPRYGIQARAIRNAFGAQVIIPETVIDGPSLLSFASIFVGAGGTMTAEAALLGVPTISCYPAELTYVDKYLLREGLITHSTDPEKIVRRILQILTDPEAFRRIQKAKAQKLISEMEDPIDVIMRALEPYLVSS